MSGEIIIKLNTLRQWDPESARGSRVQKPHWEFRKLYSTHNDTRRHSIIYINIFIYDTLKNVMLHTILLI